MSLGVITTSNGTHSPEVWAGLAVNKIVRVDPAGHPDVVTKGMLFREQFRAYLTSVIGQAMREAKFGIEGRTPGQWAEEAYETMFKALAQLPKNSDGDHSSDQAAFQEGTVKMLIAHYVKDAADSQRAHS